MDKHDVYHVDGHLMHAIPISPKELDLLKQGVTITVTFHTPRMLHGVLGRQHGAFQLSMDGEKIISSTVEDFQRYVMMRRNIEKLEETDNAQSNSALR